MREQARAGLDEKNTGGLRSDPPEVTRQRVPGQFGEGAGEFHPGRASPDDDDGHQPSAPVRVGALKTPSGRATRAALHGSHAFVADFREGLQVVDLSTPKTLRVVAAYKTTAPARDVAVAGSHVFVVVGAPSETPREFKDQEVLILKHPY